jgi:hypothetical protein
MKMDGDGGFGSAVHGNKKEVHFGPLTIDEFPIIVGESVPREGPPIALGPTAFRRQVIDLDRFECIRPERRGRLELLLDPEERMSILLMRGYTVDKIIDAALRAAQVRISRGESSKDKSSRKERIAKALVKNPFVSTSRAILKNMKSRRPLPVQKQSVALPA